MSRDRRGQLSWIDYFNGLDSSATETLDELLGREDLLIGDLIMVEVLQGFRTRSEFRRAHALLSGLEYADMVGRDIAIASAQNYAKLRRRGITIRKTMDVLIATFCIENGHVLLHASRDFEPMREHLGLRTI